MDRESRMRRQGSILWRHGVCQKTKERSGRKWTMEKNWLGGTLCLLKRIETYLHWANLRTHAACLKWKDVALRTTPCTTCGPLFPMVYGGTRLFNAQRERISSKHITNAIARMLTVVQVDNIGFTSKSMRKGGLSTAKRAGVPKALRCQQRGHQSNAHKTYESDDSTDTENNQDLPRCEPPGGFRTNHLY